MARIRARLGRLERLRQQAGAEVPRLDWRTLLAAGPEDIVPDGVDWSVMCLPPEEGPDPVELAIKRAGEG